MDFIGLTIGTSALVGTITWTLLGLLAPLAWLWMLIDAALREEWEYPGATPTSNNRLLWVLLIVFVQVAAIPYFFMVYSKVRRGSVPRPADACSAAPQAV
jgi:hypothetical protein